MKTLRKTRHPHSATTALVAGGSVAFHIAANVWNSSVLGTIAVFDRTRREVLDGTEGYRLRFLIWKLVLVALILFLLFLQLRLTQGNGAWRFSHCLVDVGQDVGSSHCARVPHHDHGGLDSMPVRIFPFSELGNRALSAYRLHFAARRAHPVSSRFIIRLLAAGSHRRQTSRPSRTPYYFAVPFFPRVNTGLRFQIAPQRGASAGFSDRLSPGSVSFLANSSEVAFRAEFPDGKIPPLNAMYWRGVVMWHGGGLEWEAPAAPAALPRISQGPPRGEAIRQWITIEPHDARWMFALDWPVNSPSGATLAPGNYLWSNQPIHKPRRYEVISYPEIPNNRLHSREREPLLQVPASISPERARWHSPGRAKKRSHAR